MKDCLRFCFCVRTLAATLCLTLWSGASIAQEAAYFALQRPGQGSVAVDKPKRVAYITDLGKSGDGDRVTFDGIPLLDALAAQRIETLVFTCSHPHSDHAGGIRALFENPKAFFSDPEMKVPRFTSIVVVENDMPLEESLYSILKQTLGSNNKIRIAHMDATKRNAFAAFSDPSDQVYCLIRRIQ
jgi:glyoxylase-like metal-dependent hydrolase (beta-lactamase superfamily II)